MITDSRHNDAFVLFFPYEKEITNGMSLSDPKAFAAKELLVKESIISIYRVKAKGAAGSFSIALQPSVNWKAILHPGCWCMIYMADHALTGNEPATSENGFKMLGIVRSIRKQESVSDQGIPMVSYVVSGQDFQTIYSSKLYLNLAALSANNDPITAAIVVFKASLPKLKEQSPGVIAKEIISGLVGPIGASGSAADTIPSRAAGINGVANSALPIRVPGQLAARFLKGRPDSSALFSKLLTILVQDNLPGRYPGVPSPGDNPSVWGLISSYCDPMVNEAYTELIPTKSETGEVYLAPSFILRALPFSTVRNHPSRILFQDAESKPSAHFCVSRHIKNDEIIHLDTGKSDTELFNFFFVPPNIYSPGDNINEAALFTEMLHSGAPGRNDVSIARYATRVFQARSAYMPLNGESKSMFSRMCADIWSKAYLYENGTVHLFGNTKYIPTGTNIVFDDRGWVAHVEQVHDQFIVGGDGKKKFSTSIAFTRLQKTNGKGPINTIESSSEEAGAPLIGISSNLKGL